MGDLPLGSIDDRYDEQRSCMICMHVHICAIRLIIKYTYVPSNYGRLRGREKERERARERERVRERDRERDRERERAREERQRVRTHTLK